MYHAREAIQEAHLKVSPSAEAKIVSELKVPLAKLWDIFPQVLLTKLSGVLDV